MLETEFDDFLDSDDDALFIEASSNLLDSDLIIPERTETPEKNVLQSEPDNINLEISQPKENSVSPNKLKKVISPHFKSCDKLPSETAASDYCKIPPGSRENVKKNERPFASTSAEPSNSKIFILNKKVVTPESTYINNRFTPGFTPQAKKRKLPGPAGLLELFNESRNTENGNSPKILAMDIEYENIVSSQFTPEHLSLSSWQKLQTVVSSCSDLHSTAKYYSIKRVLKESSKKKPPKHMIVPVLCVLLKKITRIGSSTVSIFMDDTGEIKGKIDAEVMSTYKDFMVEGTAFILKKITFLCNMLLLKSENLVSIYHPDNTERHPQTLESILETSEPLKLMKCEHIKLSNHSIKNDISNNNTPINHKSACFSHNPSDLKNISKVTGIVNKNVSNFSFKPSLYTSKMPTDVKNMRSDAFLEDLLDEDNSFDEFDDLLGNLDEKSFMEDL